MNQIVESIGEKLCTKSNCAIFIYAEILKARNFKDDELSLYLQSLDQNLKRLLKEEIIGVEHMSKSGISPRQILSSLWQNNPSLAAISKTIYNAKTKICKDNLAGRLVMQALLEELVQGGFLFDILTRGHLTHLFFGHPLLVKLAQNFPNIFIMECTYKTNRYKMTLLDIIQISSFNTYFYSGFPFLKEESEKDYIWALKIFSKILGEK